MRWIRTAAFLTLAGTAAMSACDADSDSPLAGDEEARVRVLLTDAPSDYIASATVEIGEVQLLPADGPPVVVAEDGGTFDLLELQDGVTAVLGEVEVEAGTYLQLRMIVESAQVTLVDGYTFVSGEATQEIKVPSGAQTGIKINLATADGEPEGAGIEIRPGETVLVVDFDVSQSFVMQGNAETPAGIRGFIFTPTLRAVVADIAGSIAGSVSAPEGVGVEGLVVAATRTGAEEPAATAVVAADGTFTIHFLAPGTYTVTIPDPPAGHTSSSAEVTVGEDEDVTGVALQLTATGG